jgi:hypothetical protein
VEVEGASEVPQAYLRNIPILRTEIRTEEGAVVEIIDLCPATGTWDASTADGSVMIRPVSREDPHPPAADDQLRRAALRRHHGSNHYPLCRRGGDLADHRRAGEPYPEERLAGRAVGLFLGPDEGCRCSATTPHAARNHRRLA